MASDARKAFDQSSADVERLLEIHQDLGGSAPGRRHRLEVLNKAAVVLITALWEAYCEDIAAEGLEHLVQHAPTANQLPVALQKQIAAELKKDVHDLSVWKLADDGWRDVLRGRLDALKDERNRRLNTPKSAQIDDLFDKALGIQHVSRQWNWKGMSAKEAGKKLDRYVELRGEIAHRGSAVSPVKKTAVTDYYSHVKRLVGKTGGRVGSVVGKSTGKKLWP